MSIFIPYYYLAIAILLEVTANVFLQRSAGMAKKIPGAVGILLILASFTALAQAWRWPLRMPYGEAAAFF